ncbi:small basic protein [Opitutales bacterium]|nr:small basic protein [Opitutales bacterium]
MSQHNSFKATTGGGKKNRTVLKRFERVDLLRKRGEWKDGDRVVGIKKDQARRISLSATDTFSKSPSLAEGLFFGSSTTTGKDSDKCELTKRHRKARHPKHGGRA